jgi:glycosyltransferase involved in cell wall biosynthesis
MNKRNSTGSIKNKPLVSVVCISYNQEKYIAEAIDSFLLQKSNGFDIEIIIADDASTDKTPEIIKSYQKIELKMLVIFLVKMELKNQIFTF